MIELSTHTVRMADYVRQSKNRESGSEASPATQRSANLRRGEEIANGVWVGNFEDIGISGYKDVERPDFDKLCALVAAGGLDVVIVHYMSRLTRKDVKLSLPLLMGWLASGVTIISVNEGVYRNDNIGDLISLIISLDRGHRESDNKSKAIVATKALAASLGGYVGKNGFGFTLVPEMVTNPADGKPVVIRRLVVDEDEARAVIMMVEDCEAGASDRQISTMLNRNGVLTRGQRRQKKAADSAWWDVTVERILEDPRIAGISVTIEYGTRPDGRRSNKVVAYRIDRDAKGKPVIAFPGIITPERWFALQALRADRYTRPNLPRAADVRGLLTAMGILYCQCGWTMKSHRDNVAHRSGYNCGRPRGKKVAEGMHEGLCTISMKALDDWVATQLFDMIAYAEPSPHEDHDERLTLILAEASRRFAARNADPNSIGTRAAIAADLANAEADLTDHLAVLSAWRNRRDEWQKRADALNTAVEKLTTALEEHDAAQTPVLLTLDTWLGDSDTGPLGEGSWWYSASNADRRALISLFVERITIFKDERMKKGRLRSGPDGRNSRGEQVGPPRVGIKWVGIDEDPADLPVAALAGA